MRATHACEAVLISTAVPVPALCSVSLYQGSGNRPPHQVSDEALLPAQEHQDCPEHFLHGLNYSQVAGLIGGMVTVGMFIDRIGRKWGSVTTAGIMFVGAPDRLIPLLCYTSMLKWWQEGMGKLHHRLLTLVSRACKNSGFLQWLMECR